MLVLMKKGSSPEQEDRVVRLVDDLGLRPFVVAGGER
jgi:hypothetical protein